MKITQSLDNYTANKGENNVHKDCPSTDAHILNLKISKSANKNPNCNTYSYEKIDNNKEKDSKKAKIIPTPDAII